MSLSSTTLSFSPFFFLTFSHFNSFLLPDSPFLFFTFSPFPFFPPSSYCLSPVCLSPETIMPITFLHLPDIPVWTGCGQNSLPQVWQEKIFLPASSFFGNKQKGVESLSTTCETIRVTPRESHLLGRPGWLLHMSNKSQVTFIWTITYKKGGRIEELGKESRNKTKKI